MSLEADTVTVLLIVVAAGFAFSMGAHYTGACMGMPYALRAVTAWQALVIMAPLALAGAPLAAGAVGGAALAAGVLTWGRPLLEKVAFDIVTVDRPMATAAQLVQAAVVLAAVAFGLFTSMNQALVGAMTGAGLARGRRTVKTASLSGILRGWLIGPGAGIAAGFLITEAVRAAGTALLA